MKHWRKSVLLAACVGAMAAFLAPAMAQANPYWYLNGEKVGQSQSVKANLAGDLTWTFNNGSFVVGPCEVDSQVLVRNGTSRGEGELEGFGGAECPTTVWGVPCQGPTYIYFNSEEGWGMTLWGGGPSGVTLEAVEAEEEVFASTTFHGCPPPLNLKYGVGWWGVLAPDASNVPDGIELTFDSDSSLWGDGGQLKPAGTLQLTSTAGELTVK